MSTRATIGRRGVRRLRVALAAAIVLPVALGSALVLSRPDAATRGSAGRDGETSRTTGDDTAETVVQPACRVPRSGDTADMVALPVETAEELTTSAVRAVRRSTSASEFAQTVSRRADLSDTDATIVARTLLAARGAARLSCTVVRDDVEPQKLGRRGLTARARAVRAAWTEVFGALPDGGYARGGVHSGHVDNSAHYEGRAIDVFFRPYQSERERRAGWVFAQWVVAHADRYDVLSVIYRDHIWTSWASYSGFRDYVHPSGPTTNPVLRHLDHVHVAVESGRAYRP